MISMDTKFKVKDDVVCRQVQEEEVILDLMSGTYFGLNPMGTRIWALLKKGQTLKKIHEKIIQEFAVDEKTALADLLALTNKLKAKELIE